MCGCRLVGPTLRFWVSEQIFVILGLVLCARVGLVSSWGDGVWIVLMGGAVLFLGCFGVILGLLRCGLSWNVVCGRGVRFFGEEVGVAAGGAIVG